MKTASTNSPWAYIREGLLWEGFLCLTFGGLIFGGLIIGILRYLKKSYTVESQFLEPWISQTNFCFPWMFEKTGYYGF